MLRDDEKFDFCPCPICNHFRDRVNQVVEFVKSLPAKPADDPELQHADEEQAGSLILARAYATAVRNEGLEPQSALVIVAQALARILPPMLGPTFTTH